LKATLLTNYFAGKKLSRGEVAQVQVSRGDLCAGVCASGAEGAAHVHLKAWDSLLQHQRHI